MASIRHRPLGGKRAAWVAGNVIPAFFDAEPKVRRAFIEDLVSEPLRVLGEHPVVGAEAARLDVFDPWAVERFGWRLRGVDVEQFERDPSVPPLMRNWPKGKGPTAAQWAAMELLNAVSRAEAACRDRDEALPPEAERLRDEAEKAVVDVERSFLRFVGIQAAETRKREAKHGRKFKEGPRKPRKRNRELYDAVERLFKARRGELNRYPSISEILESLDALKYVQSDLPDPEMLQEICWEPEGALIHWIDSRGRERKTTSLPLARMVRRLQGIPGHRGRACRTGGGGHWKS